MMSVSRLTTDPALRKGSTVSLIVCGMIETLNDPSDTEATVRLMPSIAIEPFSTICAMRSSVVFISYQTAFPSFVTLTTLPVPSMWPETMCPPNLPYAGIARSRSTGEPGAAPLSDVLLSVSGITSAVNVFFPISVTVRQMPLTAMLSPIFVGTSYGSSGEPRTLLQAILIFHVEPPRMILSIFPVSSIIPVNILYLLQQRRRRRSRVRVRS